MSRLSIIYKRIFSSTRRKEMNISSVFTRLGVVVLLLGVAWSCLDEIELGVPKGTEETIVIQGQVVKGNPSRISVTVSRLFDFTASSVQLVNVRTVLLRDDLGNQLDIPSTDLGIYEMRLSANDARFQIEEGKSYQLVVSTFDGRTYASTFESMEPLIKADSISVKKIAKEVPDGNDGFIERDFFQYDIYTGLGKFETQEQPYLRWVLERTYRLTDGSAFIQAEPKTCYITQRVNVANIPLMDPGSITADRLDGVTVLEDLVNFFYAEGHYLNVYQQTVSEEVFRYWDNIRNVIERSGNMFEPPAGKITSNFENIDDPNDEAFGYFFVAQQDTVRIYVSPELAGSPGRLCPPPNEMSQSGECPSGVCCDCLTEEVSTLRKPPFWVE